MSWSTYKQHKKHRNDGLSIPFNQFINVQTHISIPEHGTPNLHSNNDMSMPFDPEDSIDDVVRHFLLAISALIH